MDPGAVFRHMCGASVRARMPVKEEVTVLQDSVPHAINVLIHVVCGTAALALGFWQLIRVKGGTAHHQVGRWFVRAVSVVVVTAATGLALFRFGAFLAVLTLLVAYWLYSGVRASRMREAGPCLQDALVSVTALLAVALFLYFLPRVRFPWVPAVIYSSLGTLAALAFYDLSRFAFPRRWFRTLWVYEHAAKMLGAHGSVAAAFAGTVLPAWQPISQMAPPAIWTVLQIGFLVHIYWRARASSRAEARRVA